MPIDLGGVGSASASTLPRAPAKAASNTSEFSAVLPAGASSSPEGAVKTAYQFFDVRKVIPEHTFGIASGDVTGFTRSSVMVLRNDQTGLTVWSKAYSAFPFSGAVQTGEQSVRLAAISFDMIDGYAYCLFLVVDTGNVQRYQLFKVQITTGNTTFIVQLPAVVYAAPLANESNPVSFLRFVDPERTLLEVFCVGTTQNSWRAIVINLVTSSVVQNVAVVPFPLFAGELYGVKPVFGIADNPFVHYVTKDKTTSCIMVPKDFGSSQTGYTVIVFRASARAVLSATDKQAYQFPSPIRPAQSKGTLLATSSDDVLSFRASGTFAGVGDHIGALDAYSRVDVDRWLTEIADNAGLPAGVPLW